MALAGLAELSARVLAPRKIRVCGIAPAVTLVSGAQSPENFEAMHERNALGRGITPGDLVGALRYIIASPGLTGQSIVLDGGQHFLGLPRDRSDEHTSELQSLMRTSYAVFCLKK